MGMVVEVMMVAMECGSEMMVVGGFDGSGVGGVGVWVGTCTKIYRPSFIIR